MKGINLKKIGAIVAGSAILASSIAFAGLVYQNTPLVDANGQPVVKVVVGERAMASDGVVAAYIASKIANEAYKTSTLTAQVVGEGSCTGGEGSGTCTVVENSEQVTLEVTVPGAGAADQEDIDSSIGDYLDRDLKNRFGKDSDTFVAVNETDETYSILDDYDDAEANPYQDHIINVSGGNGYLAEAGSSSSDFDDDSYKAMVLVGDSFGPFQKVTVKPKGAGSEMYEGQYFTVSGYNYWDSADNKLYTALDSAGYSVIFDPAGDYGLPLCPGDAGSSVTLCGDTDELPAHKVYIKFLNEDWIISEVIPIVSTANVGDKETYRTDGSQIKLAKEAVSGILNVGEILDTGTGYKIRLDDIARESDAANNHPAIITVIDSNGNEICQDQIFAGDTEDNLCDTTEVKVHVYQTAPGVLLISKWAEIGIFSDEIEIEDGLKFIDDDDTEWEVAIGWANKAPSAGEAADPEYLRAIILFNDDPDDYDDMDAGEKFPVVDLDDYHKFDLIYNGVDDEGVDYSTLEWKYESSVGQKTFQNGTGLTCKMDIGKTIKVSASGSEMFRRNGADATPVATGVKRGSELWFVYDGSEVTDVDCLITAKTGDTFMKDDDGDYWYFPLDETDPLAQKFDFRQAGPDGRIQFYNSSNSSSASPEVWLFENAGEWKTSGAKYDIANGLGVYVDTDGKLYGIYDTTPDDEFVSLNIVNETVTDISNATGNYSDSTLGYVSGDDYESKFLSMRGTQFTGASATKRTFKVPKSVLDATYTFATTEAETSAPDTVTLVLGEGDEETIGTSGVKIKVVEITEQLTPCTFGTGAGAPTCSMAGVSAVIMPNNAPTATVKEVYPLTSNLVVLDRDAVGLDTGTVVTVGGDVVNTVTADAIAGSGVDFAAQPVVVRAIGNKIVVAGLTAEDTITAGQQFVAGLTRN
ncbi:MAG: S-layer protein [Candidatus ainarchaeum sp.]|nr:S-layer protein [Candidatus ainarchaeum sp.]